MGQPDYDRRTAIGRIGRDIRVKSDKYRWVLRILKRMGSIREK